PQIRGNIKTITDHNGSELRFTYYEDGNLLRLTQAGGTNADGSPLANRSFVFTYTTPTGDDAAITLASERQNPDPHTPSQSTRLYSVIDPRGHETTFSYLGSGTGQDRWKLASRTNRAGDTTSFAYDSTTRRTTVTAPLSRVNKYDFAPNGNVTTITDPADRVTDVEWTDNHVTKVTEPGGAYSTFAYNDNGYLTSEVMLTDRGPDAQAETSDDEVSETVLEYQNLAVDGADVSGKWKAGRSAPHISQLITKVDPNGTATPSITGDFRWLFTYDGAGNLDVVTDPEGFETDYAYNSNGTVSSILNARGKSTTFPTYDDNGLPTAVVDPLGNMTRFGYDDDGLLRWVQDPNHATPPPGIDERSYKTFFDYDSFHRLGAQTTPLSTQFRQGELIYSGAHYDANDNIVLELAPDYSPGGGQQTARTYDEMDRLLTVAGPDKTGPELHTTTFDYDAAGRTSTVTSPEGSATTGVANDFATLFDYDQLDRVIRKIRHAADGSGDISRTHFCYDVKGDLRSVTAPRANAASVDCGALPNPTQRFSYDDAHRPLSETNALTHERSVTYDPNGNIVTATNEEDDTTTLTYDQRNLVTKIEEPFSASRTLTTSLEYDGVGNRTKVVSPRAFDAGNPNLATNFHYDDADRLTKVTLPTDATTDPAFIHRSYDANGNLEWVSLPVATDVAASVGPDHKTEMTYYDSGWIRSSVDPHPWDPNPETRFEYTAEGWQEKRFSRIFADSNGNDNEDNKILEERWGYAPDGMLTEKSDKRQDVNTYSYDRNNNLVSARDASGGNGGTKAFAIRVAYDGLERASKVGRRDEDASGSDYSFTRFAYDLNGNVTERWDEGLETQAGTEIEPGRRHEFTYDLADRLTTQVDHGPGASTSDDQKIENIYMMTGWEEQREIYKRDGSGNWSQKQRTNWTYFLNGKLSTLYIRNASDSIREVHDVDYIRAGVYMNGHRTKDFFTREEPANGDPWCTNCAFEYHYDAQDRLVKEIKNLDNRGIFEVTDFTLDAAGNILTEDGPGDTKTSTYVGNAVESVTQGSASADYHYDRDGNLRCVTDGSFNLSGCAAATASSLISDYKYDYLNRLEMFRAYHSGARSDKALYSYDSLDRLTEETELRDGASEEDFSKRTSFSHLGLTNLVTEEVASSRKPDASYEQSTKSFHYDAYGHRISMTDDPAGSGGAKDPETYTYTYDVHGSVSQLLTDSGAAKASYGYNAYGSEDDDLTDSGETGAVDPINPYRYTGKRHDAITGQIDMGARRYGPDTAHFLQMDQFAGALANLGLSADPLTGNRYGLAGGNPVSFVEWDGRMPRLDGTAGALHQDKPESNRPANDAYMNPGSGGEAMMTDDSGDWVRCPDPTCNLIEPRTVGDIAKDFYHGGLDACGLAPGIGEFCDAANALGYAVEGDWGNAALSGAATIPFFGWGATGTKYAAKHGDEFAEGATRGADDLAGFAAKTCSFAGATTVLMADGTRKRIEDVEVGDRVIATDPETGEQAAKAVEHVFVHDDTVIDLVVDGEVITTTEDHPFWSVTDQRFERADDLAGGEQVLGADGRVITVSGPELRSEREAPAYNLAVEGIHTYHVGTSEVLVHNECPVGLRTSPWSGNMRSSGRLPTHDEVRSLSPLDRTELAEVLEISIHGRRADLNAYPAPPDAGHLLRLEGEVQLLDFIRSMR
ncbi:MAG: polymorphic toxin-type HINT domain-containing protein, partial [Actinomycetota bacterium]